MSRLPKGTSATRALLEGAVLKGAMVKAVAFMPFLAWWPFSAILEKLLDHLLIDPAGDELVGYALAAKYVIDRIAFDKEFIRCKILDKSNLTPEQMEAEVVKLEKVVYNLVRRGPVE